jgi:ABC-type multidrug transport system ATPase subunit
MKINQIKISSEIASSVGLQEIDMSKLSQVVLIAGKNGSGKSRLLNLLYNEVKKLNSLGCTREEAIVYLSKNKINLRDTESQIALIEAQEHAASPNLDTRAALRNLYNAKMEYQKLVDKYEDHVRVVDNYKISGPIHLLNFVPKTLQLKSANNLTKNELFEAARSVGYGGITNLSKGTLAAIQVAQDKYYDATHPLLSTDSKVKDVVEGKYQRLKSYIEKFLDASIGRNGDGDATIFGKPFGQAILSEGQIILLQFCVALNEQDANLSDLVLLLDEPENHLHPAALNLLLDRLLIAVPQGQIWIATHSINVLAHFDNPTTYYIDNGKLSYAGDIPEKVLAGLLGNEQEREKIANFISLPFLMSSLKFAYESLFDPKVVMTGVDDPQMKQVWDGLSSIREKKGKAKILDYGAGRGRLISTIDEINASTQKTEIKEWLDYVAFDPYDIYKSECKANIERVYGSDERKYYNKLNLLIEEHYEYSFDLVILSNVFHEIPPSKWLNVISGDGYGISSILKESGTLLIIEDQRLSHGENAHEYGFLLFDTTEFRKLFCIVPEDEEKDLYSVRVSNNGRLKAHYFKKSLISRITIASKEQSLKSLRSKALEEIKNIRADQNRDFKSGRLHAFWMNQYANAQLALDDL